MFSLSLQQDRGEIQKEIKICGLTQFNDSLISQKKKGKIISLLLITIIVVAVVAVVVVIVVVVLVVVVVVVFIVAVAHHSLTDAQTLPERWPLTSCPPSLHTEHAVICYRVFFIQFGSVVPAVHPLNFLCS